MPNMGHPVEWHRKASSQIQSSASNRDFKAYHFEDLFRASVTTESD